jgi:hypothetical protein
MGDDIMAENHPWTLQLLIFVTQVSLNEGNRMAAQSQLKDMTDRIVP